MVPPKAFLPEMSPVASPQMVMVSPLFIWVTSAKSDNWMYMTDVMSFGSETFIAVVSPELSCRKFTMVAWNVTDVPSYVLGEFTN